VGQRANYAIVEAGQYRLFYHHWGAESIDRDLFWGPEHVLAFIRAQRELAPDKWLDDVWCEGGAVVHLDARVLTFFGNADGVWEIQPRRLYLRLLARPWVGWTIRWAHEGIADLADAVGYPRERVVSERITTGDSPPFEQPAMDGGSIDAAISVADEADGLRIYPARHFSKEELLAGPRFLEGLEGLKPQKMLMPPLEPQKDGVHINRQARTLDFWTSHGSAGFGERVRSVWPGWTVTWHQDEFEVQERLTQGAVRIPRVDDALMLVRIKDGILREPRNGWHAQWNLTADGALAIWNDAVASLTL
jgi:hypothetical protein